MLSEYTKSTTTWILSLSLDFLDPAMISNGFRIYRCSINFEAGWSERIGNPTMLPSGEILDRTLIYTT